jgi:FKBP-type peptidyl-prolyl cis-trans isomerase FklB
MKKLNIIIAVALVAAFTFTSCNSNKPKLPELKTQLDSLNYALGLAYGDNLKTNYIKGDSAEKSIKNLMAGITDGQKGEVEKDNAELADLGTRIGSSMKEMEKTGLMGDSTLKINVELIKQGMVNGMKGLKDDMTAQQAQQYLQTTMMARQSKKMEAQYGANKAAGEKFLAENKAKAGVTTTASGLQYEVIKKGNGPLPTDADKVKVHYHGTLLDGTVFDSSVQRKEPVVFPVTGVIKGWTEALKLMPVGSKFKIYVPQELAYGGQDRGPIKPFSMLIFEVELLEIVKDQPAAAPAQ